MMTSLGNNRTLFFIGGVPNVVPLRKMIQPRFMPASEIPIDYDANYAYQMVPVSVRGFPYNIRNGTSYAVMNNELRWPFMKGVVDSDLARALFDDLQIIGFIDAGTAWSGRSPFAKENAYDYQQIIRPPVTTNIDCDRSPFVMGIGFGVADRILGHYIRFDWAWGIEKQIYKHPSFYLSFNSDF